MLKRPQRYERSQPAHLRNIPFTEDAPRVSPTVLLYLVSALLLAAVLW